MSERERDDDVPRDVDVYVQLARDLYQTDEVEIDFGEKQVSETDDGMWVRAWVWVSDEDE